VNSRQPADASGFGCAESRDCPALGAAQFDGVTLEAKLADLVSELEPFEDLQERLAFVVDRAKRAPVLSAEERIDAHRVRGCISVVWLVGELRDGRCVFRFDADSPIVRGLLALLCDFFGDAPPAAIAACELDPIATLGLARTLSPTRLNGLASARARIREFARQNLNPRDHLPAQPPRPPS
jgi:cysteine desulfuration protein SufE